MLLSSLGERQLINLVCVGHRLNCPSLTSGPQGSRKLNKLLDLEGWTPGILRHQINCQRKCFANSSPWFASLKERKSCKFCFYERNPVNQSN